ncbi:DNA methylase family protein [Burkholderia pseudomallei TSV44]|uniref:site-specific DNA-methyltransferase n=1 Tax=Burkholderia pseudomallei TaxID=28450 RepID=UPI0005390D75|nr:site-specific DNA-methyltransferase [Burkholderia pseudomallei]KGX52768.1 DNA methylase family protein [Burkholderia pseudomallei TSV44]
MATKKELLQQEVAKAVGAGKAVALETVDFNDPDRPKTCLEVDFPILPVNQVAVIEGNAGKPIYQMSKWWARRRSSVFRSMLIAAATKAPDDPSHAAKLVWDNYYANHQKKGAFKHLKVGDIFMGGGTTLVEGSRLGMQMVGNDLNPVAWFVVKQELANVDLDEVKKLLADIEAEVKPQIMPYYYCDGPEGEKGKWTHLPTNKVMPAGFVPLTIPRNERKDYRYEGPEIIYTFWAKHGPCQVTGCGHRTPIMTRPVIAVKTLTVKSWEHTCGKCREAFDVEEEAARMAPDASLYVAPTEAPYSVLDRKKGVICPHCGHTALVNLGKGKNKKVELSLLVHPQWLAGEAKQDPNGQPYGGSAQDDVAATTRWDAARAGKIRLLEVRGALPDKVTDPETGVTFAPDKGTVPKPANFACAACGTVQPIVDSIAATQKTGPTSLYAVQGYAPKRDAAGKPYGGRFFSPADIAFADQYDAALAEWEARKDADLKDYWPRSAIPFGHMTHQRQPLPQHGYLNWSEMFNPRQLLVHAQLLKTIVEMGDYDWTTREYVLGAFQNYLRNQSVLAFWHVKKDHFVPALSNNNFHPKSTVIEVGVFSPMGYGPWSSCVPVLLESRDWAIQPWEAVSAESLKRKDAALAGGISGKSEKVFPGDPVNGADIFCGSSTELATVADSSLDLVITDPPFGDLLHYSELSDFFYVWLRLALKDKYPDYFRADYTPKSLEAVANRAREPEDPDGFYQRLLTQCWREAHRVLKPSGILAFTFHHSEDEPWVAVLESLFDAGYYLEATYPIRSDETKGEGEFGSKTIEYDIIHVCRKRTEEPKPVSWGRMRREVMADVRQLQAMLENHAREGLPAADIQVIRRGKALEYFSRHYGKVYVDEGRNISVRDALVGINQLIDEDADKGKEAPPVNAEPITRQFLRTFGSAPDLKRDQLQKFLKGSITTPDEFVQRGWCAEKNKVFTRTDPLDFAREWSGRHRRKLTSDLDQALVLVGACFDNSGINASDTLKNENFKPHVALKPLLEWLHRNGPDQVTRNAASRATTIYNTWAASQGPQPVQASLFDDDGEYGQ